MWYLFVCLILLALVRTDAFSLSGGPIRVANGARTMTMMPIGVPKVAYRMPGSRGGEWVDIYNRLTRERIIFMGSEIDDEMANQIIGVLLVRIEIASEMWHYFPILQMYFFLFSLSFFSYESFVIYSHFPSTTVS